jgi:hypothetical protein
MPVYTSPVARYAGEIELPECLTFAQFSAWRDAVLAAQARLPDDAAQVDRALLPGIFAVVKTWRIERMPSPLTPDNFPATPRKASNALIAWIVQCVSALVNEEEGIPKV